MGVYVFIYRSVKTQSVRGRLSIGVRWCTTQILGTAHDRHEGKVEIQGHRLVRGPDHYLGIQVINLCFMGYVALYYLNNLLNIKLTLFMMKQHI